MKAPKRMKAQRRDLYRSRPYTSLPTGRDEKARPPQSVEGFEGSDDALESLAKTLKQKLGTGGSTRDGEILIQGNRKNDVTNILRSLGYKTK